LRDKDEIDFFIDRKIEWATDAMLLAGVCSVSTSLASRIAENRFHSAHYCGRALGASTAQSEKKTLGTISDIHNYCKMNISSVAGIAANFNSMIEAAVDTRQRILSISHLIGVGRADELVAFIDLMLDAKKMFCDDFSISECIESVLAEAKADGEVEGETKAALFLDYLEEKGMLPRREGVDLWTRDGQIWLLNNLKGTIPRTIACDMLALPEVAKVLDVDRAEYCIQMGLGRYILGSNRLVEVTRTRRFKRSDGNYDVFSLYGLEVVPPSQPNMKRDP
jgi:hypothetical protein